MGIDLYFGALSRYFCHDWETAQQRTWRAISRGEGPPLTVTAPDGSIQCRRAIENNVCMVLDL